VWFNVAYYIMTKKLNCYTKKITMIRHFNLNLFVNNKNNNDKKPTSKYSNQSPEYSPHKIKKNMILDNFVSSKLHLFMFENE